MVSAPACPPALGLLSLASLLKPIGFGSQGVLAVPFPPSAAVMKLFLKTHSLLF